MLFAKTLPGFFPAEKKPGYMLQLSTGKFDDSLLLPFFLNHIPTADMATKNTLRIKC